MTKRTTYTVRQAAAIVGFRSPSMVDYLCRSGVLIPSARKKPGRGRARQYTYSDLVYLRILKKLLDKGVSVAKLKRGFQNLRKKHKDFDPSNLPQRYFVTDGIDPLFKENAEEASKYVLNLATEQYAFAFIIDMTVTCQEVTANLPVSKPAAA